MLKTYFKSTRIAEAKAQGLGVIAYFTDAGRADGESRSGRWRASCRRAPTRSWCRTPGPCGYLANDIAEAAVATGLPVWPYPLHRRADRDALQALGMPGAVTSNIGYLLRPRQRSTYTDQWAAGAVVPGELTRDPYDDRFAVGGARTARSCSARQKTQHFLTLGNLGPITADPATRWSSRPRTPTLPADPTANLTLAFGHQDDAYYEHQLRHRQRLPRDPAGRRATRPVRAPQGQGRRDQAGHHEDGRALPGRVAVLPARGHPDPAHLDPAGPAGQGPTKVTVTDKAYRGGYLHIGRGSTDGVLALRGLKVSHPANPAPVVGGGSAAVLRPAGPRSPPRARSPPLPCCRSTGRARSAR